MRLVRPEWLFGWGVLPVLAILIVVAMIRQRAILVRLGEMSTVARLAGSASPERRGIKAALILVGGFFLIAAMAQPQWGRRSEPVFQRGVDVFVALDVSTSMLSQDVAPNRLARGKAFISKLLNQLEGDRIGLIAVAGSAFVQCPLTLDRAAARLFLDILDVGDVPDPGSDLGEAIDLARQSFPASTGAQRVLVLVTDGEDFEGHAVEAARRAAGEGIVVYTVGTGTPGGGPIPLRGQGGVSGGYKKDEEGRVVTTRLEAKRLESMARAGKGRLFMATTSLATADVLAGKIDRMTKADLSSRIITVYRDRFQIPLALAFLILLVEGFISGARRDALEPSR